MSGKMRFVVTVLPGLAVVIGMIWLNRWGRHADLPDGAAAMAMNAAPPASAAQDRPRAVVVDNVFDLGTMNPGDQKKHSFVVRNEGTADLKLELGSTSCKCTLANLDKMSIPPGGSDVVELEWRAENPQFRFRQGAVINTNDPALRSFELIGEGSVRVKLGSTPETAYLDDVPRETERTIGVALYSQAFSDVTIGRIASSLDAVSAVVSTDAAAGARPPAESRFVRDLVITLRPQSKSGHYQTTLSIEYVGRYPDGTEESGVYELAAAFDVSGDFTITGRDVLGSVLSFGTVSSSQGAKKRAFVHVRGHTADGARLTPKRTNPATLLVQTGEPIRLSPTITRFPVTVEIPRGSPLQAFTAETTLGEIELSTTYDDRPTVRFPVSFIVVP